VHSGIRLSLRPLFSEGHVEARLGRVACAESAGACLDAAILRDARLCGLLRMRSEQVAPSPHGEEARSAVSNHESAEVRRVGKGA
jgi:hypothetical protein